MLCKPETSLGAFDAYLKTAVLLMCLRKKHPARGDRFRGPVGSLMAIVQMFSIGAVESWYGAVVAYVKVG